MKYSAIPVYNHNISVFRWVRQDKQDRINYLPNLLKGIRMGLLEPEYFMTNVKGNTELNFYSYRKRNLIFCPRHINK